MKARSEEASQNGEQGQKKKKTEDMEQQLKSINNKIKRQMSVFLRSKKAKERNGVGNI